MREYLIFKVTIKKQVYIDAYRIDDKPWLHSEGSFDFDEYAFCSSPSRTEAKRAAWRNWINKDLIGFNKWHKRMMDPRQSNQVMLVTSLEVEEISLEDLEAAADFYDKLFNKKELWI